MPKPLRVLIATEPPAPFRALFEARLSAKVEHFFGPAESHDYQVLVKGVPERADLEASAALHSLVIPYAGVPQATRERVLEFAPHLKVYNLHHNAQPTAEMAIALLFAASKQLVANHSALAQDDWRPRYADGRSLLLHGKHALLLGYGAIGQRIAKVLEAIGMSLTILRRQPDASDPRQQDFQTLHQELPKADVLMIAAPLTAETEGMIGAKELALLPSHALVVNIGRGTIIDEAALYAALRDEKIGGAGIDVWYHYPRKESERVKTAPSEFPFGELSNVTMSPHCGGHSDATEALRAESLAALLDAIANDAPPAAVDLQRGY